MNRTQHRFVSILAAGAAALAFGAAPALAGSDGCVGGDCQDENTPAPVVPVAPVPVAPESAPAPTSGSGGGDVASEGSSQKGSEKSGSPSKSAVRGTSTRSRTVANRTVAQRTVPQGAVSAGAGGMAPDGSDGGALFGLAGAGMVLLAAGGRLVAVGRRTGS